MTCVSCLATAALLAAIVATPSAAELILNTDLTATEGETVPSNWTPWEPDWEGARCEFKPTPNGLRVSAPSRPFAVGGVQQTVRRVAGGQAYALEVDCALRKVAFPHQAAAVRVYWLKGDQPIHPAGTLIRGPYVDDESAAFRDMLVSPGDADGARIVLEVRWPRGGTVTWQRVSVKQTTMPAPRKVKLGTVYLRPSESTPEGNLDLWCEQLDEAGRLGLDIVCLGEAIRTIGTGKSLTESAEPIPGPSTVALGEAARRNNLWVVGTIIEQDGTDLYNTALLIDREGHLAGTYRKTHLPREEWRNGISPGGDYPVFTTDFGTIGIQICYDWFFPEVAGILARKGAEVIFAPTWGSTFPDRDGMVMGESTFRVRARDNGVYLVPCVYDGNSLVIDPLGRILASNEGKTGVFWAEVDLDPREPLEWVGHWRSIGPRDRMPETYSDMIDTNIEPDVGPGD
ncbi:MAG TPA: carbon-nitrogen hydrolase family protein [Armatimonadota bacterium]|nr:carbon-nitrogen hydrolase family protein [Armatimonadota bacterium]